MKRFPAIFFGICSLLVGLTGCNQSRTEALQSRQDWMNSRAANAAERRQIRSDNMDARVNRTFDAM